MHKYANCDNTRLQKKIHSVDNKEKTQIWVQF